MSELAFNRTTFPGISSRAWEHPADRAALQSLRRVPGFDVLLRKVFGMFTERAFRIVTTASAVEVGPTQYAEIHRVYEEVLGVLDAPERYQLFLAQTPFVNAGAVGMDKPFIVLNSGLVLLLSEEQLRCVLAHEVAHIMSDHVLYKTLLALLLKAGKYAFSLPLTGFALLAVTAAMLEWDRKSELSADRAALLVAQNPDHVRSTLLRMAGGVGEGASIESFREQARRYEADGDALDSVIKTVALLGQSHPFPVHRVQELDRWIESGGYDKVLSGEYPRRENDTEASAWSAWSESVDSYREGFKASTDPVAEWFRGVGGRTRGWWKRRGEGEGEE